MFFILLLVIAGSAHAHTPYYTAPGNLAPTPKIGQTLSAMFQGYLTQTPIQHSAALTVTADGLVAVDATASGDPLTLLADLEALGMRYSAQAGMVVSGLLPISALEDVAGLQSLRAVRPAYALTASTLAESQGSVVSQGDALMKSDLARAEFGVDGSGVNIGVISDSFNCQGEYITDIENGDLPDNVNVVLDIPNFLCKTLGTDEGRAIMQVIHDVAPGAGFTFYSGFESTMPSFVRAIDRLAKTEQVDIIISDYVHLSEPMFQDGLIAQAVNSAVASSSVVYIASAGNGGQASYEIDFDPGLEDDEVPSFFPGLTFKPDPGAPGFYPTFFGGIAHDFDSGPGKDFFQRIIVPEGTGALISLQWDSPFFSATGGDGTPNDLDVFILDQPLDAIGDPVGEPTKIIGGSSDKNKGLDAIEVIDFFNPAGSGQTFFNIMVVHSRDKDIGEVDDRTLTGPTPGKFKYVTFLSDMTIDQYNSESASVFGQAAANGALAVGATYYNQTPHVPENFSSYGPTEILFDSIGNRLTQSELRQKPDVMGPDGVNIPGTTQIGTPDPVSDGNYEGDGIPNYFGTSASAAHAAGVAALIRQAAPTISPATLFEAMRSSATD